MTGKNPQKTVEFWHNPRCSKSRAALSLLEEKGIEINIRLYLENAPNTAELEKMAGRFAGKVGLFFREKEQAAKDLGLKASADAEILLSAMAKNPKLIERPIAFIGDEARVGRPPESVLELL